MKHSKLICMLSLVVMLCFGLKQQVVGAFYEVTTINTIEITFTESNWDEILDTYYAAGDKQRLEGTVSVNGTTYNQVGIRYKGNSSYNASQIKNPLNIKLDYLINGQSHEGYGTIKLSNVYKDPSFVRETLSYEIARKYMPASLANYANVYINGTYYGLYVSVQDVDKDFAESHFNSRDHAYFKGDYDSLFGTMQVWTYLGDEESDYTSHYAIESDDGWDELINFLNIFNSGDVATVLNVDQHLWMLAFDNLLVNLDAPINFAHNFYLYKDDSGRFNPIIWDLNESFGAFNRLLSASGPPGSGDLNTSDMQQLNPYLNSTNSNYPIISKVLSNSSYKKMYIAHMRTIISENFSNGWYTTRANELQAIVDSDVQADPNKFSTYSDFTSNIVSTADSIVGIQELMTGRVTYLQSLTDFQASPPTFTSVTATTTEAIPESVVTILAHVSNATTVYLYYWYEAFGYKHFQQEQMVDDGLHNDGAAGDGVYGASINAGYTEIHYYTYAENSGAGMFSPERAAIEYYTLPVTNTNASICINELMAENDNTISDPDGGGGYPDWIELYNASSVPVSLEGMYLTDDISDPTQWEIPSGVNILAGGHLIIWADNDESQGSNHANFKLSSSGETIALYASDGTTLLDMIAFGAQTSDISYGRETDGSSVWKNFLIATPGSANGTGASSINYNGHSVIAFPNPGQSVINFSFDVDSYQTATVRLFNISGEQVSEISGTVSAGQPYIQWFLQNIASGIYIYQSYLDGQAHQQGKVCVKK